VLARLERIPSRVVVGYPAGTAGVRTSPGNYVVKTSDAHAWPELYFSRFGWLRMEPTPSGTGIGQGTARAPAYSIPLGSGSTGSGGASNGFKNRNPGGAGGHLPRDRSLGHQPGLQGGPPGAGTGKEGPASRPRPAR